MATFGVAGVWLLLAAARPATTWHLAPVLIVLAPGWVADHDGRARRARWVLMGAGIAVVAATSLHLMRLLRGPALIGESATNEAAIVIAVAVAIDLVVLMRRHRSHRRARQ